MGPTVRARVHGTPRDDEELPDDPRCLVPPRYTFRQILRDLSGVADLERGLAGLPRG
jgi:hypothetical protein